MAKKKRTSIFVAHEGYREMYFIEHISQFNTDVNVNLLPCYGISAANVLNTAFKRSDCGLRVIAFFDEDFEKIEQRKIDTATLDSLTLRWGLTHGKLSGVPYRDLQDYNDKNKNPILAVSWPNSIEGMILSLIGTPEAEIVNRSTAALKIKLDSLIAQVPITTKDSELIESYDNKIAMYNKAIANLSPTDPKYKEWMKYYTEKNQELGNKKNAVRFKRFLVANISLDILQGKRNAIKTIDTILKWFGL